MTAFFDSNALVYLATDDPRKVRAVERPAEGGAASVPVLNEFANVAHKKLRVGRPEIELALAPFRSALDTVAPVSLNTHTIGMGLARDH